jgi:two-component system phosphate regulon response regulator OmpR
MRGKVLIVDDDTKLRKLLKEYLEGYGYQIRTLSDGLDVTNRLKDDEPDIIILDIMMPKKDGLEVLQDIRRMSKVPVIMLTAKGEDTDRIVGLEMGADDYLPKPFNPRELLARIKAIGRRIGLHTEQEVEGSKKLPIRAGGLVLNKARQTVEVGDKELDLSSTEYKILKVLMERPNRVLNRDQLMNLAKGKDFMAFDRSIDVHISKLRAKVESDPGSPKRIKTVWGTGYMFVDTS